MEPFDIKKFLLCEQQQSIITHGLYFGYYDIDGWEIVGVEKNDEKNLLEGVKITVTFTVTLVQSFQ